MVLASRCSRCGREIPSGEDGYFRLNEKSDRFDLRCKYCYEYEVEIYGR